MNEQAGDKTVPYGSRVLLSLILPGAGQLANGHKAKGIVTIIVSAVLFVDIIVHTFILSLPIANAWLRGEPPVIDETITDPLGTLLLIIGLALAIWVWALVDTIRAAKRQLGE